MAKAYKEDNDALNDNIDTSESDAHGWNRREHKSPCLWYVLLIAICAVIAWILSSMGK